ncbi:Unknown protein, partial [Striga hermonthica]
DDTHAGAAYAGRWEACMYPLRYQLQGQGSAVHTDLGSLAFGDGGGSSRASQRSAAAVASRLSARACRLGHHFAWLHPV